jgi:hypothetical protein
MPPWRMRGLRVGRGGKKRFCLVLVKPGRRQSVRTLRKSNPAAFKPGCAPGPGRPPGMRNRLTEIALQALGDDFAEHGAAVIEQVRRERPHHYLSVVASLLPRQVQMEKLSPFSDITDDRESRLRRRGSPPADRAPG